MLFLVAGDGLKGFLPNRAFFNRASLLSGCGGGSHQLCWALPVWHCGFGLCEPFRAGAEEPLLIPQLLAPRWGLIKIAGPFGPLHVDYKEYTSY